MNFRDCEYNIIENSDDNKKIINNIYDFTLGIAPKDSHKKIEKSYEELDVVMISSITGCYPKVADGEIKKIKTNAGGLAFFNNVNNAEGTATTAIAIRKNSSTHVIAHEMLHVLSSEITEKGTKRGTHIREYNNKDEQVLDTGLNLNESITDALASRFNGKFGSGTGAGYGTDVIVADLLMGENLENNKFLQNVYWEDGKNFTEDFNNTVTLSNIKFEDFYNPFKIMYTDNTSDLLMGAVEYKLKKAKTVDELNNVAKFQKETINLYKDDLMEIENIELLGNVQSFADSIKIACVDNLNQNSSVLHSYGNNKESDNNQNYSLKERVDTIKNRLGIVSVLQDTSKSVQNLDKSSLKIDPIAYKKTQDR